MKIAKKELAISLLCISGVFAVAYGMANKNDALFIIGLILIIVGYLFIRKKMKNSLKNID